MAWPAPPKQTPPKSDKERDKSNWADWLKNVPTLTAQEAGEMRASLIEALRTVWKNADDLITRTNRQKAEAWIWQSIDDEDTAFLADGILAAGMRMPVAAYAVRKISESWGYYRAGVILLPRFVQSVQFYGAHGGFGGFR